MRALRFGGEICLTTIGVWALAGHGLVNYDTLYTLVWGREIAAGRTPDLDVAVAPTPHPLADVGAVLLAPLSNAGSGLQGQAAMAVVLVLSFVALALLARVVFALGRDWFGTWAGVAAALIVVTRVPVLDFGARAYVDIPFIALVLGALLVETRRPRAGWPVLALLAAAGLLRPEAWLFSFVYVGWLAWETRRFDPVFLIALVAPVGWMLHDVLVTGDPLHSWLDTRESAQELNRITGIDHVPTTMPRRLGEILRESGLLAAAIGGVLAVAWRRAERGVRIGVAAGVVAVVAFCILAAGGLPIRTRYLMLTACILAVFAGAGLFGWMTVEDRRHRRWWAWLSAVALLAVLVTAPNQVDRIRSLRAALATQVRIQDSLGEAVEQAPCEPYVVPNRRPVPLVALWRGVTPGSVAVAQDGFPASGSYVFPRRPDVAHDYILDPSDLDKSVPPPPAGWRELTGSADWRLAARCSRAAAG
jgi:hypothetical protein